MKLASLRLSAPPVMAMPVSRDLLDRLYVRVFGFAYQVLGDAELAAQAAEHIFLRRGALADETAVWRAAILTIRAYLARGFVVRPLVALTQGWQGDLLHGLAQLTPMERALLLLRYHEGLEIAMLTDILDLDERTVRAQIAAARSRLLAVQHD